MRHYMKHYLSILRIELEDLKEDLEMLIDECRQNREDERITDHVFLANLTLFKNELLGVDEFYKIVDKTDYNQFHHLDAMIEHLRKHFREKIKAYSLAEAVNVCIERKLKKVAKYVTQ